MAEASHTLAEILKGEGKEKKETLRQPNISETSSSKLDPLFYRGEFRPYTPKDPHPKYEDLLEKLIKYSEPLQDWIERQKYEISQKYQSKHKANPYNFNKELSDYLQKEGRDSHPITRIEYADIGNATAGITNNGYESTLLIPHNFEEKLEQFANHYNITKKQAEEYVLAHELVHAYQAGKKMSTIQAELDVEITLSKYFMQKENYDLAKVASDRAANVYNNYGNTYSQAA